MYWIALQWLPEAEPPGGALADTMPSPQALGWWALQFTPRVAWVDEALLLEVSTSLRLWGGPQALLRRMHASNPAPVTIQSAQAAIGVIALALLRLRVQGQPIPSGCPAALPLHTLSAARAHLPLLARLGLRTWGEVHALPRGPMVRRFGTGLRRALDIAWGLAPEGHRWLTLPEVFDQQLELPARVGDAPALMWAANRLLASLRLWLRARQLGVLAFELEWRLDLKRLNGGALPSTQSLVIRTAEPAQAMAHLRRLLAERLARTPLLAPAVHLRLRSVDTAPWAAEAASFLPEDQRAGDALHVFVERVGARLGPGSVLAPTLRADHRPECMQGWRVGQGAVRPAPHPRPLPKGAGEQSRRASPTCLVDALAPTWLLREPLPLGVQPDGQPCHHGPLRLLAGPHRIETGWWCADDSASEGSGAARDYYIAQNAAAGLLWIYRERATAARQGANATPRWFLQGLYA
ncbi:MAG: DNA polymerase Y family protein [Pseudomonadota bacterium]|nr:DNA polymerase Y family protein [Pseudomonadota bacterium]